MDFKPSRNSLVVELQAASKGVITLDDVVQLIEERPWLSPLIEASRGDIEGSKNCDYGIFKIVELILMRDYIYD